MVDTRSSEQRRRIMQAVRAKDTGPELTVRRLLHRLGYRYRLHRTDLPGTPDLVFPSRRKAVFVHGCFWHGHDCRLGRRPKSRRGYWLPKLRRNSERDREVQAELERLGWRCFTVWQCELSDIEKLTKRLEKFLGDDSSILNPKKETTCRPP